MTFLPSLPDSAKLLDVFRAYPDTARPLVDYHEALMRGPSPLTVAERELVAAYVSGLNSCDYCYGIHSVTAERFGVSEPTLSGLIEDLDTADVDDRMRPLLRYVGKLTSSPARASPPPTPKPSSRSVGRNRRCITRCPSAPCSTS